jgi:hypothetical protein
MRLNILVVALALVTACTTAIPDPSPTLGPEADLEDTVAPTQPPSPPSGTFTEDVAQASPRSEADAYAALMCEALGELPELEPQLNVLREGAVETVDSIAEARASLSDARRLVAAAGPWPSGAAFRQAMLDSLDQIDAQLRAAAASASDGGAFGDTLAAIPFITTDRVEVELQQVIESGFRC